MTLGTVLVTGGAGFIGTALADLLIERADRWIAFDSLHPQVHPGGMPPAELDARVEVIVGDVADPAQWDRALAAARPDTVIHLAAETGTAQSLDEASRHSRANVVGTTELTDAFGRSGHLPAHVVLASSRAVYGEGSWRRSDGTIIQPGMRSHAQLEAGQWDFPDATAIPMQAGVTPPAPTSVYGATKLAQENLLNAWGGSRGVPVSILRLQNVYGPGQSLINSYTGIVSLFSQWAREGKSIPLYEDGAIVRDFVFIEDVASAIGAVLTAGPDASRPVLDVGTGVPTTIRDMADAIARYYSAPAPVVVGKFRDGDVRAASADISATTQWLDWSPNVGLDEGVARLQEWIAPRLASN